MFSLMDPCIGCPVLSSATALPQSGGSTNGSFRSTRTIVGFPTSEANPDAAFVHSPSALLVRTSGGCPSDPPATSHVIDNRNRRGCATRKAVLRVGRGRN